MNIYPLLSFGNNFEFTEIWTVIWPITYGGGIILGFVMIFGNHNHGKSIGFDFAKTEVFVA